MSCVTCKEEKLGRTQRRQLGWVLQSVHLQSFTKANSQHKKRALIQWRIWPNSPMWNPIAILIYVDIMIFWHQVQEKHVHPISLQTPNAGIECREDAATKRIANGI